MEQESIKCPACGESIRLTEAISHDIYAKARRQYETEFEERLKREKQVLEARFREQAEDSVRLELDDLRAQVTEERRKLEEAGKRELDFRKKQRELEEKEKALELEITRKLDEERRVVEERCMKQLEESHRLRDAEKDKKLSDALRQVEELRRKMEQGSQQTQGEVLELQLEEMLCREFPFDVVEPVSKGVKGGDILHTVKTQSGRVCGKILWETKRTKNWSDAWISKLKDDQREAKAGLAVLVSESLPAGFHHFREIDGVWVTDVPSALSLAIALRVILIQVAVARQTEMGKQGKKDLIYNYVTGPEFRNRVTAIIEGFNALREELEAEKRAMQRIWDKRAKQIERVISNTSGMYGDLEGLAGTSFPAIQVLELPQD